MDKRCIQDDQISFLCYEINVSRMYSGCIKKDNITPIHSKLEGRRLHAKSSARFDLVDFDLKFKLKSNINLSLGVMLSFLMHPGYILDTLISYQRKKIWQSWMHLLPILIHPRCIPKRITLPLLETDLLSFSSNRRLLLRAD